MVKLNIRRLRQLLLLLLLLFMLAINRSYGQQPNLVKGTLPDVVFNFRFNQSILDSLYMDNAKSLSELNRVMGNRRIMHELDSIVIVASASPDGPLEYNKSLAERRANAVKQCIMWKYPYVDADRMQTRFIGEEWGQLEQMVMAEEDFLYKSQIINIIRQDIPLDAKERRLKQIGQGAAWHHIERNYLRYLRTGAACVLFYQKRGRDTSNQLAIISIKQDLSHPIRITKPEMELVAQTNLVKSQYVRPIAIKTNLIFDALTLFNIEVEIPIGKRFSVLGEWTFPWWGGLGNKGGISPLPVYSENYTVQMLSGGVEGRYWFSQGYNNSLTGWFLGLYTGAGIYDLQSKGKGVQGDFYISMGISGGYAHPIGKSLQLEYSLGLGYLQTTYEKYTSIEGRKVYQNSGRFSWIGPVKAKISLVWMPQFKIKRRR